MTGGRKETIFTDATGAVTQPLTEKLETAGERIAEHLDAIGAVFKETPKITLIIRTSDTPGGDVIMSNDDLQRAIDALIHHQKTPPAHAGTVQAGGGGFG